MPNRNFVYTLLEEDDEYDFRKRFEAYVNANGIPGLPLNIEEISVIKSCDLQLDFGYEFGNAFF